jgi:hypothetical protein
MVAQFKMTAQLYGIAVQYNIIGLSALLQNQLQDTAKTLNIFDVLSVAQSVYQILLQEDNWFTLFLKKEMEAALVDDTDLFTTSRFLDLVGTVKVFDRILMRIVAEIYNEKHRKPKSFDEVNLGQEVAIPCDEPAPFEEVGTSYNEPPPSEAAVVHFDEPVMEDMPSSSKKDKKGKKGKKSIKGMQVDSTTESVIGTLCDEPVMEDIPSWSNVDQKGKKGKKNIEESQVETRAEPVIEALDSEPAPFEQAAVPCDEPPPWGAAVASWGNSVAS